MKKSELKGKIVGILLIALIVLSVFSGAVSAGDSVAFGTPQPDNKTQFIPAENCCDESAIGNATTSSFNLSERIDELLEEDKIPFLIFYADWCGFCEKQKPVIEELEQEYADRVEFIWLNENENREGIQEFGVTGYPTMFLIVRTEDEGFLYRKFGGYTEKEELVDALDMVIETGTADKVRSMSFDEGQRNEGGCASCGNLSDFNLSFSQENLTSDEFSKEISDDPESLELYNRANEKGYTELRHSQKIEDNIGNEIVKGTLVSEEGKEVQLVKFSSQSSSFSFSQENITSDELFKEIANDSESLELYNRASNLGYAKMNQSQKLVVNNETTLVMEKLVSEEGDEMYFVEYESQNFNKSYLIEIEDTIATIHTTTESYSLDFLEDFGKFDICLTFCMDPNAIDKPVEVMLARYLELGLTMFACTPAVTALSLAVCLEGALPACLIFAGCAYLNIKTVLELETFAKCVHGCEKHSCAFAEKISPDKCDILYENTYGGKDPYNDGAYCYYNRILNQRNDITKCCSYGFRDKNTGTEIITEKNIHLTSPYSEDLWLDESRKECGGFCLEDKYYPPIVQCTQEGMTCNPGTISIPVSDFCVEKGYEKGQCGKPEVLYCSIDEPVPDKVKSFPGNLWCWTCSLNEGQICSKDSDCSVNVLGHYCAPSCTGGASHCCPTGKFWSEASQDCVSKCDCHDDSDCGTCSVCEGGYCEPEDTAISDELRNHGYICCDGLLYVPLGVDPNPLIMPACCNDNDCDTVSGEVCYNHFCTKIQGSCYYEEECAPGYCCDACEGKQLHCCLEGMKWDGTKCVVDCLDICPPRKCMDDWAYNEYSCRRCTEDEISQSLCKETSGGCFYGDPCASGSPCEQCDEDCVRGYCECSVGCAEYQLPDDHGYMDCTRDSNISCDCQSTCARALRLYDPMNFILDDDTGYLYNGCLYHGCANCGANNLICSGGNCVSGDPIEDFINSRYQCMPDTTVFWNDYAHEKTSGYCNHSIKRFRQKCVPASQRYTFSGDFCEETSDDYRPDPIQVDEHHWKAAIYNTKMKNRDELREKICYEEKSWGCYENDGRYLEVFECKSPVPSNYWICDDDCYNPDYYECCKGERLVLKDHDGDGFQDHKCCIVGIEEKSGIDPNHGGSVKKNVIVHDNVDIVNDPQNCGGCSWVCTKDENGACKDVERNYTHVCTGTEPQCCHGNCIVPSPVLTIKGVSFYPDKVIEGAEETIIVTVDYGDPHNYGKDFDINLTLYIDNSPVGSQLLSLQPKTAKSAYFLWEANLSAGDHELQLSVDIHDSINVCGEINNKPPRKITVHKKPDLTFNDYTDEVDDLKEKIVGWDSVGDKTVYLKLPKNVSVENAVLDLIGPTVDEPTGSFSKSFSDSCEGTCYGGGCSCGDSYTFEPEGSGPKRATYTITTSNCGQSWTTDSGEAKQQIICHRDEGDVTYERIYIGGFDVPDDETKNQICGKTVDIECDSITLKTSCSVTGWCSHSDYYPGRCNRLTANFDVSYEVQVPADLYLDVGNDGTDEWSHSGEFTGTATIQDFSNKINDYLETCEVDEEGYCNIPLILYSDSAGAIKISNININYKNNTKNYVELCCYNDEQCDDNNPCTEDKCDENKCVHKHLDGTSVDGGTCCEGILYHEEGKCSRGIWYPGSTACNAHGDCPSGQTCIDHYCSANCPTFKCGGSGNKFYTTRICDPHGETCGGDACWRYYDTWWVNGRRCCYKYEFQYWIECSSGTSCHSIDKCVSPYNLQWYETDVNNIASGDIIPITTVLHNIGGTDTNQFLTALLVDDIPYAYNLTSLNAGESREISFNWTAILGEHYLTIIADSLPVPDGIIPESMESNNKVSMIVNVSVKGNTFPILYYITEPGYFFDGVVPDTGNESTIFEYRIKYTDYDNNPPASGHPQVWIDVNGDGDYDDVNDGFSEGGFAMNEVNVSDSVYSDGKIYTYSTSLPCGADHTYKFSADDVTGMTATGVVDINRGPYVEGFSENQLPIPKFTYSPENPVASQTITFNASYSHDLDGTIEKYEWGFGDGNITNTNKEVITHSYSSEGTYRVTLTVTDDDGATNRTTKTILVATYVSSKERIVFASDRSGNWDIWMMDPDGTNLEQLTTNSYSDTSPQISPDGTKIVFLSDRTGSWQVWLMNSDGSNEHQLFDVNELPITYEYEKSVEYPTWAPDGSYLITHIGLRGVHSAPWSAIYRHNPDGTNQQLFLDWGPSIKGKFSISNDGSKLAYCREDSNYWSPTLKISVGDIVGGVVNGTSIYNLASAMDGQLDEDVVWFPNDTKLMWSKSNNPAGYAIPNNLYSMNVDETDSTKLTYYTDKYARVPDFSPDKKRVVFTVSDETTAGLYTMNPDGSDIQPLLVDDHKNSGPCWGIIDLPTPANQPPIAIFTYSPESPVVNQMITFDASSSYDPDGTIENHEWDFGDGTNATGEIVAHSYASEGTYSVTLTVTDDNGATNSTTKTIQVATPTLPIVVTQTSPACTIGNAYYSTIQEAVNSAAPAGTETLDLFFLIDGSQNMGSDGYFNLQIDGIASSISAIPRDGTVSICVIQFSDYAKVEVPLTLITPDNANGVSAQIRGIVPIERNTNMSDAFYKVAKVMQEQIPEARSQILYVSSDGWVAEGNTMAGRQAALDAGLDVINVFGIGESEDAINKARLQSLVYNGFYIYATDSGVIVDKIKETLNSGFANAGNTIIVCPGTYTENVDVNKSLTIKSYSGNPEDTIVKAASSSKPLFNVTADYVNISGFTAEASWFYQENCLLINNSNHCNISNNTHNGCYITLLNSSRNMVTNIDGWCIFIFLRNSSSNTITNNDATDGIWLQNSGSNTVMNNDAALIRLGWNSDDNTIKKNNVHGGGIYLGSSNNNIVANNNASNNVNPGIYLECSNNNTVTNNIANSNLGWDFERDYGSVYLEYSNNNTLSNNSVSNNVRGIELWGSNNNTVTNNNASNNHYYGIDLFYSSSNTLSNNTASNNSRVGIWLWRASSNNTLINNTMLGNKYNFGIDFGSIQNIDTSNTVDGKPIYYWVDQHDRQVPTDAGFVGIVNSTNITVKDLTLTKNTAGVLFTYTENSRIENVTASDNWEGGIVLYSSSNNNITNNIVSNNLKGGIWLEFSNNDNLIYNNYFINNTWINAYDDGNNQWNITKTAGTNIIGGPYLGGNYWSDYNGNDTDEDGIGDTLLPYNTGITNGGDWLPLTPTNVSVETSTGTGTATFSTDAGEFANINGVDENSLPQEAKNNKPEGLTLPHGLFNFTITDLTQGQSVTLTITLPSLVPVGGEWWKVNTTAGNNTWYSLPIGDDDGDNVVTITLTDGGLGDNDGAANGVIKDPSGIGILSALKPGIISFAPTSPVNDSVCTWRTFNVTVIQTVNVSWYLNEAFLFKNESLTDARYTLHAGVIGEHNVTAIAENGNGNDRQVWVWNVTRLCGDVAPTGEVDMGDVIRLLNHVGYPGNSTYALCNDWAGDCRCTGVRNMGDVVLLLNNVSYPENTRYVLDCC